MWRLQEVAPPGSTGFATAKFAKAEFAKATFATTKCIGKSKSATDVLANSCPQWGPSTEDNDATAIGWAQRPTTHKKQQTQTKHIHLSKTIKQINRYINE